MLKVSISEVKKLAEEYGLKPCKIQGSEFVQIRTHKSSNLEDISWEEFEKTLENKKLAVYKAGDSDFLKIMKDK